MLATQIGNLSLKTQIRHVDENHFIKSQEMSDKGEETAIVQPNVEELPPIETIATESTPTIEPETESKEVISEQVESKIENEQLTVDEIDKLAEQVSTSVNLSPTPVPTSSEVKPSSNGNSLISRQVKHLSSGRRSLTLSTILLDLLTDKLNSSILDTM